MNIVREQGLVEGFTQVDLSKSDTILVADQDSFDALGDNGLAFSLVRRHVAVVVSLSKDNGVQVVQLNSVGGYHFTEPPEMYEAELDLYESKWKRIVAGDVL